jgi:hypothetical protein
MALDIAAVAVDHRRVGIRDIVLPTLPSFAAIAGAGERATLLAGLTFVEAATVDWTARDLVQWSDENAPLLGWRGAPPSVAEMPIGTIALRAGAPASGDRVAQEGELPKLLLTARWKVAVTLRGLLSGDDSFLNGAIFSGRVRRDGKASEWLARPSESDALSQIVLSLFVADILAYREFHESNLCVCDVCARVSYNPQGTGRAGCVDHVPSSQPRSSERFRGRLNGEARPLATALPKR